MDEAIVRRTADGVRAEEWALALASLAVPAHLRREGEEWALVVLAEDTERAERVLDAFDAENRAPEAEAPPPAEYGGSWLGVTAAIVLVWVHGVAGDSWYARGSADAARILSGEWWRVVTALTLHADIAHLLGNLAAAVLLVGAVGQWLGPGVGAWLLLGAGAAGNLLTALVHRAHHDSIGASTVVFAALGALGAAAVRRRTHRRRSWVIVAAAVALLGVLGTGERADLLAHLFGFLAGGAFGVGAAIGLRRAPGRAVQWPLALLAAAAVVACWRLAR